MSDEVEMGSLVTPSWLAEHLADPDLVVLDVRVTLTGHGPIGDHVDLETRFADLPPGRIITYCGGGIATSAAAFAMLRAGVEDVAVYTA